MSRFIVILRTARDRAVAKQAIDRAPYGYAVDIKESSRSLEQNRALHGLVHQIMKQRATHNGLKMDVRKWKGMFLQALGEEIEFIPTLDGTSVFPMGLSSRELPKERFSMLIELILAWCAQEGLIVKHFDADSSEAAPVVSERERRKVA